jgi:hypothetical protein
VIKVALRDRPKSVKAEKSGGRPRRAGRKFRPGGVELTPIWKADEATTTLLRLT